MNDEQQKAGRQVFREILGEPYQQKRDATTNDFNGPIRRMSEEFAYAGLWSRPGLDRKTRSLITIAVLTGINRSHELKVHLQGAINNGCTVEEIREALTHTVAYCGFPAAIDGLRTAEEVLREQGMIP
jgi:4-carboxymuconolactone decarboxylase